MIVKYFHAEWCGPCSEQKSIINEIEDTTEHTVDRIDIEENKEEANEFNVRSLPSIVVVEQGTVVNQFTGVTDKETILHSN